MPMAARTSSRITPTTLTTIGSTSSSAVNRRDRTGRKSRAGPGPDLARLGVYAYGSSVILASNTFNAENYWVDVLFSAAQGQPPPPAMTSPLTASGTVGAPFSY